MALARLRQGNLDQVARLHPRLGLGHDRAVDPHRPLFQEPRQPRARQDRRLWHIPDKRLIKALRRIIPDPENKRVQSHG